MENDEDINCYTMSIATVLNEIIHTSVSFNDTKLKAVMAMKTKFRIQSNIAA